MNALTAALKEELNVEMVSVFGLQIPESVVVSWGIMVFLVLGSILLTRNLRVDHITKRQAILEKGGNTHVQQEQQSDQRARGASGDV